MPEQKIEPPAESDIDDIARAVLHAEHVVQEALGSRMDGTKNDLSLIQRPVYVIAGESPWTAGRF